MNDFKLFDVVALTESLPQEKLKKGHVGTIVEVLNSNTFEVEFSDNEGKTFAVTTITSDKLLQLSYQAAV
ncbi:MAG: DUF4926 domain-containing protein [Spirochaetia bacterium]|nr:DUF4926 domain-containing protein [Spirochaetia bacterium]